MALALSTLNTRYGLGPNLISYIGANKHPAGVNTAVPFSLSGFINQYPIIPTATETTTVLASGFTNSLNGGITIDSTGNVYVTTGVSGSNGVVSKITPAGVVSVLATGFYAPDGLAVDSSGNVYTANTSAFRSIKKITPGGVVTTINTGSYTWSAPYAIVLDSSLNIYVSDNTVIIKITPGGALSTFASGFGAIYGLAIDSSGNIYVADGGTNLINKVTPAGVVTTIAGSGAASTLDGQGTAASINEPDFIAVDSIGNLYVSDRNLVIRKITSTGYVTTLPLSSLGLAVDSSSTLYGIYSNGVIKITPVGGSVTSIINGPAGGSFPDMIGPYGLASDPISGFIYIADGGNNLIRKVAGSGTGNSLQPFVGGGSYTGNASGHADGNGFYATFNNPKGIAIDSSGIMYVADTNNNTIRTITSSGYVTTFAGGGVVGGTYGGHADGLGYRATFFHPIGIAVSSSGIVYVSDSDNNTIRKISADGTVTTLAGTAGTSGSTDGTGAAASFNYPLGIAVTSTGIVYVADSGNSTIRKITASGVVSTFATGFGTIQGVAVDSTGNVYAADGANTIKKITPAGVVTILAGSAAPGTANGVGLRATFNQPSAIALDAVANIYVMDSTSIIRKIT